MLYLSLSTPYIHLSFSCPITPEDFYLILIRSPPANEQANAHHIYTPLLTMQSTFTSNMEPVDTHDGYPKYARRRTEPGRRARTILDKGTASSREDSCTRCLGFNQDCYRYGAFSKCAFCTAEGKNYGECHLKGEPEVPSARKRRKL